MSDKRPRPRLYDLSDHPAPATECVLTSNGWRWLDPQFDERDAFALIALLDAG